MAYRFVGDDFDSEFGAVLAIHSQEEALTGRRMIANLVAGSWCKRPTTRTASDDYVFALRLIAWVAAQDDCLTPEFVAALGRSGLRLR